MPTETGEGSVMRRMTAALATPGAETESAWKTVLSDWLRRPAAIGQGMDDVVICQHAMRTVLWPVASTIEEIYGVAGEPGAPARSVSVSLDINRLLVHVVRAGLPTASCTALLEENILTKPELHRLVIKPRTLQHRLKKHKALSPEESERAVRVARIWDEACQVFGTMDKAGRWLRRPTRQLGGEAPIDLLDTEIGARQVENALGEIAHGMAA